MSEILSVKEIINKLDFIKIKNVYSAIDNVKRMKTQATVWEKIFAKDMYDKGLLSKIHKELSKLSDKKTINLIKKKKRAKDLNRYFIKEYTQVSDKHMKRCSTSYIIREVQIKTIR